LGVFLRHFPIAFFLAASFALASSGLANANHGSI
jgi:hypothetical protein